MILAIDPGTVKSAWVMLDEDTCKPLSFAKSPNDDVMAAIIHAITHAANRDAVMMAVEMVASYGMPVGREVFETCVWIGRFAERWEMESAAAPASLIYRRDVKLHHCGTSRANDATIKQALIDRFAPGAANHGKGTKADPGWFYGFSADIWQAYALGVLAADRMEGRQGVA